MHYWEPLTDETLSSMTRPRHSVDVNEDTLAVGVQLEAGIRGDHMLHPHTLKTMHSRERLLHKDLFDASGVGSPYQDTFVRAQERWQAILREQSPAVGAAECQAVDEVVSRSRKA